VPNGTYVVTAPEFDRFYGTWDGLVTVSTALPAPQHQTQAGTPADTPTQTPGAAVAPTFVAAVRRSSAAINKLVEDVFGKLPASYGNCQVALTCMVLDTGGFVVAHPELDDFARRRATATVTGTAPRRTGPVFVSEIEPQVAELLIESRVLRPSTVESSDALARDYSYAVVPPSSTGDNPDGGVAASPGVGLTVIGDQYPPAGCAGALDRLSPSSDLWVYRPRGVDLLVVIGDRPFQRAACALGVAPPGFLFQPTFSTVSTLNIAAPGTPPPLSCALRDTGFFRSPPCVAFSLKDADVESVFRPEAARCNPGISRTTEILIISFAGLGAILGLVLTFFVRRKLIARRIDRSFRDREINRRKIMEKQGLVYPDPIIITGPAINPQDAQRLHDAQRQADARAEAMHRAHEQSRAQQQFMAAQQQQQQHHHHQQIQSGHHLQQVYFRGQAPLAPGAAYGRGGPPMHPQLQRQQQWPPQQHPQQQRFQQQYQQRQPQQQMQIRR
jgi:hypothetical protein